MFSSVFQETISTLISFAVVFLIGGLASFFTRPQTVVHSWPWRRVQVALHLFSALVFIAHLVTNVVLSRRAVEFVIVCDCLSAGAWTMSAIQVHGRSTKHYPAFGTVATLSFLILGIIRSALEVASLHSPAWFFTHRTEAEKEANLALFAARSTANMAALLLFIGALWQRHRYRGYTSLSGETPSTNSIGPGGMAEDIDIGSRRNITQEIKQQKGSTFSNFFHKVKLLW